MVILIPFSWVVEFTEMNIIYSDKRKRSCSFFIILHCHKTVKNVTKHYLISSRTVIYCLIFYSSMISFYKTFIKIIMPRRHTIKIAYNNIKYKLLPLLWVRSKLTPCGGIQRFDWNGYSAALGWWYCSCTRFATSPLWGITWLLWSILSPVYALDSSPSSPVQESHRSLWLPDYKK